MSGLIFLALAVGWFSVSFWIGRRLTGRVKTTGFRLSLMSLVVAVLLVLPVADEIIGGFQFRALCRENAILKIDAEKIKGKMIYMVSDPSINDTQGSAIPIHRTRVSYRDVGTHEELASSGFLVAMGGRLVSALAGGHQMSPLTIFPSTCSGPGNLPTSKKYQFTLDTTTNGAMQ